MKNDNFKFHNESSEDPDCFVKKLFLLIVARTKIEKGAYLFLENVTGKGRRFRQHMIKH